MKANKKFNLTDSLLAFENGDLDEAQTIELFQHLIDNGMAWQLQGHYGRSAQDLIDAGKCTQPKCALPGKVGPYEDVRFDSQIEFDTGRDVRKFRVIAYGAFNAMGLIGTEYNGVAILDEDNKQVLCDELGNGNAAFYQQGLACQLCHKSWAEFKKFVNASDRRRYAIE